MGIRIATVVLIAFFSTLTPIAAYAEESMSVADAISRIQQQIKPGMTRGQVEWEIARIPNVNFVWVPAAQILPAEERTFAGTKLSGRISVITNLEIVGLAKAQGGAVIDFDEHDRVVDVRTGGFGIGKQRLPAASRGTSR